MRRAIASLSTWWLRALLAVVVVNLVFHTPSPWGLLLTGLFILLFLVRPAPVEAEPQELCAPVTGRWVALNSPGTSVPSHGVKAYGQMYAVDITRPGDAERSRLGWGLRGRAPEDYPAFGEAVRAVAAGVVVRVSDGQRDPGGCSTWPRLLWMMTLGGYLRELGGARFILGNHVIIRHEDGVFAAYAHLQNSSPRVAVGDAVTAGQTIACVGNTGNSSEPHLHVQLMDREKLTAAAGLPMRWTDIAIDPSERDPRWGTKKPSPNALRGFPETGQVFRAGEGVRRAPQPIQ